jgi:peptidoglycan hydrolase-like protein with peptidoglycan-binding domain
MERQQPGKRAKINAASRNNFQPKAAPHKLTPLHPVLQLQQRIGNQAVQRLLREAQSIQRAPAVGDETLCDGAEFPPAAIWFSDPVLARIRAEEELMTFGSAGESVALVQQALVAWGCDESLGNLLPTFGVDGKFGGETRAAVKTFQKRQGVDNDGVVGSITMGELDRVSTGGISTCPAGTRPAAFLAESDADTGQTVCLPPGTPPIPLGKGCPTLKSGVTGIHEAADNFSGRSRTKYGVGESVKLSFESFLSRNEPPETKAVPHAGLRWSKASGPGAVTQSDDRRGTGTYKADHNTGRVTLELKVVVGPCAKSTVARISFTVVAPTDGFMRQSPGVGLTHFQNTWSIGFLGEIFLEPKNVSFNGAEFAEGEAFATADGFLKKLNGERHPPSAPGPIGSGNSTTGCKVVNPDRVFNGTIPPPFSKGDFLWEIPWQWRVGSSALTQFAQAKHHATADENGRATLEKKGAGPFAVNAGDPTKITFFIGDL